MVYNIIGEFIIIVFGVMLINVGIWVSRNLNNIEYDKDARNRVLLITCILGAIYYIVKIVDLLHNTK